MPSEGCTEAVKPTISEAMASAGCIGSSSYSHFLDEVNTQNPSILFGGVDTTKFTGPLVTLHTNAHDNVSLPDRHLKQALRLVQMTTRLNGTAQQTYKPMKSRDAVDIDSGSKGIVLPDDWVSSISNGLQQVFAGGKRMNYTAEMAIPCDDFDTAVSLDFTLADETERSMHVGIPLRELVVPLVFLYTNTTQALENFGIPGANASNVCVVNIKRSSAFRQDDLFILGDSFFRSAYTYSNLDQNTISIARPAYNSKSERVVPIGKGAIPELFETG